MFVELKRDDVLARLEVCDDGVALAVLIPRATLREHAHANGAAVDGQHARGALVVRADGTAAVGIAPIQRFSVQCLRSIPGSIFGM